MSHHYAVVTGGTAKSVLNLRNRVFTWFFILHTEGIQWLISNTGPPRRTWGARGYETLPTSKGWSGGRLFSAEPT